MARMQAPRVKDPALALAITAYAKKCAAEAPPFTPEQLARLRVLFRGDPQEPKP